MLSVKRCLVTIVKNLLPCHVLINSVVVMANVRKALVIVIVGGAAIIAKISNASTIVMVQSMVNVLLVSANAKTTG